MFCIDFRMTGLLKSGAMKPEHKPVWFEVYEAFPPKYEPRADRHQLPYGEGGNVAGLGPPRQIFYKEDLIRANFYKVFFPQEGADSEEVERVREVFNLVQICILLI
jgi:small subunit ribosomal protein S23